MRAREDRDRGLLDGGTVSAKQMTDLEHELMERREAIELDGQHAAVDWPRPRRRWPPAGPALGTRG